MEQLDAIGIPRNPSARASGNPAGLVDVTRDDMAGSGTDGQPTSNVIPRIDTHWSRIFYYDLFAADTADSTRCPDDLEGKETLVATKAASRDAGSRRLGSRIRAAAILLAICIAMYLAVGGVIFVLASPDAAAITTEGLMAPAAVPALDVARRNGRAVLNGNRPR